MDYEVILTYPAKAQFDHAINYILFELENEQAALSVINDAEDTKSRLSHVAGSLKMTKNPLGHFHAKQLYITHKICTNC